MSYDCLEKIPRYGQAGVPECWLIDLSERVIEIYREPHFEGYETTTVLEPGDTARPLAFPDVEIDIAALLRT